ncbi:transposase [Clostridium gasigenes]|uniref:transposase n=1 Tax=Clostridium gasigenes TaxID=94869 RepID=UPI001C0B80A5|nr:transposase [Clostridium gasigenes]
MEERKKESRCRKWNTHYFEVVVNYGDIGLVKLYISRFPYQKDWRIFISTDTNLKFVDMMEIYLIRWSIEVFFKEAKQNLGLCNCQSRDFDAQIANVTISCILYTFFAYYRRITDYETLGTLFEFIKDDICKKTVAQNIWDLFDELLTVVIKAISE